MPPGEPWELASSGSRETMSSEAVEPIVRPASTTEVAEEPVDGPGVEDPSLDAPEEEWLLPPPAVDGEAERKEPALRRSNAVELQEVQAQAPEEPVDEARRFLEEHQGIWIRRSDQDPVATWAPTARFRCDPRRP